MASVKWLHLSDLHFTKDEPFDRRIILRSLLDAIAKRVSEGTSIDFIIISGDIAFSGQPEEYRQAEQFISELLKRTGLKKDRLVLIAGNHDVDRQGVKWLSGSPNDTASSDEYFAQAEGFPHLELGQKYFRDWYNAYFPPERAISSHKPHGNPILFDVNGIRIVVQPFNSAIFSRGNNDQGSLLLGRRPVFESCEAVDHIVADLKIAVVHHPFDWLREHEQQMVRVRISDAFNLILRGHLHKGDVIINRGPIDSYINIAAGAAYQTDRYPNTCFIMEFDKSRILLEQIAYSAEPRPVWTQDTAIFANEIGGIASIEVANNSKEQMRPAEHIVTAPAPKFDPLRDYLLFSPQDRPLYVEPRLMSLPQDQVDDDNIVREISISEVCNSDKSFLIEVIPEYGATLLAKRLESDILNSGRPAKILNALELPSYKAKLSKIFDGPGPRLSCLILDNFDQAQHSRLLIELKSLHIADRFVLIDVPRASARRTSSQKDGIFEGFEYLFLWSISRSDVRHLATNLFDSSDESYISSIVDKTYGDLLGLCIPLTPANVIMYLRVLYKQENFSPLNRVEIVEEYIAEILRRPSDYYSDAFNARNKIHIISAFAYNLYNREVSDFSTRDWVDFCESYKSETLVQFDAPKLLEDIKASRIVAYYGDRYWFKYHFFFSYFVGKMIASRHDLLEEFIDNETYLKLYASVEVVAGLSSDNTRLVSDLVARAEEYVLQFESTYIPHTFEPYRDLDWVEVDDEEEKVWSPLQAAIEEGPHAPTEVDTLKTATQSEVMTGDQTVRFEKLVDLETKLFVFSYLLIEALKNSDEIAGDLKSRALRVIGKTDTISLQLGLMLAEEIAQNKLVRWGGIAFLNSNAVSNQDEVDDEAARVLSVLCAAVIRSSVERLASKKLGAVFLKLNKLHERPAFSDILNFACLIATKPIGWGKAASDFLGLIDRKSYYTKVCLGVLIRNFKEDVCSHKEREELKNLIALVRAKRLHKKSSPGAKAVNAVRKMLEDKSLFAGKGG